MKTNTGAHEHELKWVIREVHWIDKQAWQVDHSSDVVVHHVNIDMAGCTHISIENSSELVEA